jgi:hypothetical protein
VAAARPTATRVRTLADGRHIRRAAARTGLQSRAHRRACARRIAAPQPESSGSFSGVTGFYIAGGVLAAWALLVSALGIIREDFPASAGTARVVSVISIILVLGAVGTGIYLSATVEHEPEEEHAAAR